MVKRRSRKSKSKKKQRYADAKKSAAKRASGFDFTTLTVPEGVNVWRPKQAGSQRIDIVPYVVGEGNPEADKGMLYYERTYYVHRLGTGKSGRNYVCPRENFDERCPVCEHNAKIERDPDGDDDLLFYPKRRQLFNILVHGEEDKGVQLWEFSYHMFGRRLDDAINNEDEDEEYHNFFHLDGMTLKLSISDTGQYGLEVSNIEFKSRKKSLSEDLIEEATCLDDIIKEISYKELKKRFASAPVEDDEDEDDEDDELDDEDDELDDEDDELDDEDDELDDEDDELDDDEDEDEDDELDDEEPPRKKKSRKKVKKSKSSKKKRRSRKEEEEEDEDDDELDEDDWA